MNHNYYFVFLISVILINWTTCHPIFSDSLFGTDDDAERMAAYSQVCPTDNTVRCFSRLIDNNSVNGQNTKSQDKVYNSIFLESCVKIKSGFNIAYFDTNQDATECKNSIRL